MNTLVSSSEIALAYERAAATLVSRKRPGRIRRFASVIVAAACGFAATIALATTVSPLAGFQTLTVLSDSMRPTLRAGDVVVDRKIHPLEARIGDVVTFKSPESGGRLITHRVVRMKTSGRTVEFETRGDANTGSETWSLPASGTIGRVEYRVPKLGYLTNVAGSRFGRFAFLVVPVLLLGALELKRIWRPSERKHPRRPPAR